jgi:hypothetical protein
MRRKLRIAFSILCSMLCLLLIGLWVRGYYYVDQLQFLGDLSYLSIRMERGQLVVSRFSHPDQALVRSLQNELDQKQMWRSHPSKNARQMPVPGWRRKTPHQFEVVLPFWSLVLVTAAISCLAWIPWPRGFSLRTLLIGMTLAAVGLTAIVFAVR